MSYWDLLVVCAIAAALALMALLGSGEDLLEAGIKSLAVLGGSFFLAGLWLESRGAFARRRD